MVGLNGVDLPGHWPLADTLAQLTGLSLGKATFSVIDAAVIVTALAVAFVAPNSQQILSRFAIGLDSPGYNALAPSRWNIRARVNVAWACGTGIALGAAMALIGGYSEFIYFQF